MSRNHYGQSGQPSYTYDDDGQYYQNSQYHPQNKPPNYPPPNYPPPHYPPSHSSYPTHPYPKHDQNNYQYAPPPVPPPSFPQSQSMGGGGENVNDKFNPRPRYRDLWAAILFLLHFVAFVVVSVIALRNFAALQRSGAQPGQDVTLNWSIVWLFLVCVGIGFVLSIIYLSLMHRFPKQFIKATFIASIIFYWGATIYFIAQRVTTGNSQATLLAIFTGIMALLYTLFWFWWKPLIPFSSVMLRTVTDITKKYKSMVLVAFGGLLFETMFSIWWIFTLIAAHQTWENGKHTIIIVFLLFSFYWTTQVIQSWIHVVTSGVFATYYFLEGTPGGVPSSPTLKSAKRASTTSFGSICLGSLLVAILQVIRALLRSASQDADDPFSAFCAACAIVILGCIDSLLQYFNFYAYTQVAIYGKSFWESAKDTWKLIKDRGIEAIINDSLIGNVLMMGAFLVGVITALLSFLYTIIQNPSFNNNGILVFVGFIIGFQMVNTIGSVILSGTATTFVCLAEDPDVLARTKPELYNEVRITYPRFVVGM